jgi:uncharacterized protein YigE (DUF2233 family)
MQTASVATLYLIASRRRLNATTLACMAILAPLAAPAADWTCTPAKPATVPAGTCLAASWSSTAPDGTRRSFASTSLVLGASARLRLVEQTGADQDHGQKVSVLMSAANGVAAVNGGYFTRKFAPAGLLLVDGRTASPRSDETALSGFLAIDADGKVTLRRRSDDLSGVTSVRQAGPFLIDPGGEIGIRPSEHPAVARRTVVLATTSGQVALVTTTDVTLHDLATCLHDHAAGFGIRGVERALNLDGGPSTAMSVAGLREQDVLVEKAAVRDVVVVTVAAGK